MFVTGCQFLTLLGGIAVLHQGKSKGEAKARGLLQIFCLGVELMQQKKQRASFAVCPLKFFLIPVFTVCLFMQTVQGAEVQELIPAGKTVGVTLDTAGLLVLGTGSINGEGPVVSKKEIQAGDRILKADGKEVENKEVFQQMIENSGGNPMTLLLERDGRQKTVCVTPVFSAADNAYKIGIWVRDSIQGIGTLTFFDPKTKRFGALGHGVYDVDTGQLMTIREGALAKAELTEIIKGEKGEAGELIGTVDLQTKIARVEQNTEAGIFGSIGSALFEGMALQVAKLEEIRKGDAVILSDLEGDGVKEYAIVIENIRRNHGGNHKDLTIRITDERLLGLTGGIVQGMSGSPIIQDGKLVGAVTYVLVNDPTRGYGIFIENMLEAAG